VKKQKLIELVEKYDLTSRSRKREILYKRHFIMAELYEEIPSLSQVGDIVERDHATVLHGIREHKKWMEVKDAEYLKAIDDLYREIYNVDVNDLADQNIHVRTNSIHGSLVDISIRFVSLDVNVFRGISGIITKEEFKKLL